ncbi:MAG: DUF1614 domain-containing protein [Eubacteriales bacterium]|nr:DUF1614 domain-containing protein [Eubacteriales bacterium]MDD3881579.1 DUF1614 domain-containing protein [Eubacteriales bacterium]MDD4512362.1 DUF1614 domain-containing protein [Eubacteriales bacterium]
MAVFVLLLFGVGQRVMDKMRMNDKWALVLIAAIIGLSFVPNIEIGSVSVNIGGALIPLGVCVWLLIKCEGRERLNALIGTVLTAAAIYGLGALMPSEPEQIVLDPNYTYGIAAGIIAYIVSRSRRNSFICAVLGLILTDVFVAALNWGKGIDQRLVIGSAGILDSIVVSGLIAVLLSEIIGEIVERISRASKSAEQNELLMMRRKKEGGR